MAKISRRGILALFGAAPAAAVAKSLPVEEPAPQAPVDLVWRNAYPLSYDPESLTGIMYDYESRLQRMKKKGKIETVRRCGFVEYMPDENSRHG